MLHHSDSHPELSGSKASICVTKTCFLPLILGPQSRRLQGPWGLSNWRSKGETWGCGRDLKYSTCGAESCKRVGKTLERGTRPRWDCLRMLSGPACKFLSSLQLGVRNGFLENAASELGCEGLTCKLCTQRESLEVEPARPGSEGGFRDGSRRLG